MNVNRIPVKSCCGKTSIVFEIDQPITKELIGLLGNSYKELQHFTRSGLMHLENSDIIMTGTIGQNRITIQSRKKGDVSVAINNLEDTLKAYG